MMATSVTSTATKAISISGIENELERGKDGTRSAPISETEGLYHFYHPVSYAFIE